MGQVVLQKLSRVSSSLRKVGTHRWAKHIQRPKSVHHYLSTAIQRTVSIMTGEQQKKIQHTANNQKPSEKLIKKPLTSPKANTDTQKCGDPDENSH